MESTTIHPARSIQGVVRIPGDKSISHRYAMLAAIAQGTSRFHNFSAARDCFSTLGCVQELGAKWRRADGEKEDGAIEVIGLGSRLQAPKAPLDCGNSGSTIRMLSGILAGQPFATELFGDESLSRRPMARVIKPLSQMGAKISSNEAGRPPLTIQGGQLKPIHYKPEVASAQVKTCLLFAGLFADGETTIEEPIRTRDHGELALQAFGAEIERKKSERGSHIVSTRGGQELTAIEARVPGDLSSAAFFLCAAALFPGSHISLPGILMNPTRARLLDILIQMRLKITVGQIEQHYGELVGSIEANGATWLGGTISGADTAALIDEIPVLAAIAPYSENGLEVSDARELRVKESDRIAAVATNLRKMGAELEERPDGLRIPGRQTLHGAELDSFDDHRIAMAFAIAALRAEGETQITNSDSAGVSYPTFFEDLSSIADH
ncbi:MAG TPA: 3-phosphoshikimate 1-carboxyvinyltransferase [Terriglobales bacterium]|nr:3-phosphoshikimate 1-carboxyvinyltransferase [Terriglobales bacterium]